MQHLVVRIGWEAWKKRRMVAWAQREEVEDPCEQEWAMLKAQIEGMGRMTSHAQETFPHRPQAFVDAHVPFHANVPVRARALQTCPMQEACLRRRLHYHPQAAHLFAGVHAHARARAQSRAGARVHVSRPYSSQKGILIHQTCRAGEVQKRIQADLRARDEDTTSSGLSLVRGRQRTQGEEGGHGRGRRGRGDGGDGDGGGGGDDEGASESAVTMKDCLKRTTGARLRAECWEHRCPGS